MADPLKDVISDGFVAPLGDVIAAVGRGVADAQAALDQASLQATLSLYETEGDAATTLLREIGYRPTFYVLPETTCEVQMSMRVGGSSASDGSANAPPETPRLLQAKAYATPVDASFANRFGYEASASAKLTFKIVPVPPPLALDERRPVPDLLGKSVTDASAALARLGFEAEFHSNKGEVFSTPPPGGTIVLAQSPAALTLAKIGEIIVVTVPP
ncbi:PASTA domain-containing protein [Sphingomonas parva]|uniref:PASTA domain-containing protein n=1 Tax=Sphingomonas parva TaxID=2555898 RepID=A0A4Y8ZQ25_9SPHN|nr:PASTA domain-containing protein [Sphingomonas parva]TFI58103.1 PASTA domain-containing protein [Sphingomonas parva]